MTDQRTYKIIGGAMEVRKALGNGFLEAVYQPDFICFDEVLVGVKALSNLTGMEESQIINDLKATGLRVGLLLNFGSKSLEHKRFVYNLR